jgi:uncharacterized damage-inducible protein DinB
MHRPTCSLLRNFLHCIHVAPSRDHHGKCVPVPLRLISTKGAFHIAKRLPLLFAFLAAVPTTVFAQAGTPAPVNPISAGQKKMYVMLSGVVISAAEKMPEESYGFKPTPDVRSFGQLVGHLADFQQYFCSFVEGEAKPGDGVEKSNTSKAELVAAPKEPVSYCNEIYVAMTDSKGSEMMKLMNQDFAKLTALSANTAHDYEHYGNMVTYMRSKGIVPLTSEKSSTPGRK